LAVFYIFLFYDRLFLHVRNLEENSLFSTLIFSSVFSDYVVFCGDVISLAMLRRRPLKRRSCRRRLS